MLIRRYKSKDIENLARLFYNTVHTVNIRDYSLEQVNVWASGNVDTKKWDDNYTETYTIVAEIDNDIVGFGNIDIDGYLDMLYVHKDYQNQGIATEIVNNLEAYAKENRVEAITTFASITALPFFEKRGYKKVKENTVKIDGVRMINYYMEKL